MHSHKQQLLSLKILFIHGSLNKKKKKGREIWYELLQSTQFCAVYLMDTSTLPSFLPKNAACEHTDTTVQLDEKVQECVYLLLTHIVLNIFQEKKGGNTTSVQSYNLYSFN